MSGPLPSRPVHGGSTGPVSGSSGGTLPETKRKRPDSVRRNTIIVASSSIVNGGLNAVMVAVSARQGETGEIAAYTVMTAALAWVAIVTAGGSSLLYTTGGEMERQAVRSQRLLIAVPSLVVTAVIVTIAYTDRGYSPVALAAAGVSMIGTSLFELQSADLVRQLRFVLGAVMVCGSKSIALALIVAGTPLTAALAAISIVQLIAIELTLCRGRLRRAPMWHRLSGRLAGRALLMNRQLFLVGGADIFTWRGASTALSLVAPPQVVGQFGAIVSGIQALAAVFHEGLKVPMAIRARRRHSLEPTGATSRDGEVMIVAVSILVAVTLVISAPWITRDLLNLPNPEAATWLRLLASVLPLLTIIQAMKLNRIGDGEYRAAARLSLLVAVLTALFLVVQFPGFDGLEAARTHATAAVVALGVVCLSVTYRWVRRVRRSRTTRPTAAGNGHRSCPPAPATVFAADQSEQGKDSSTSNT